MIISWTEYWRKMSILPIKAWFGDWGVPANEWLGVVLLRVGDWIVSLMEKGFQMEDKGNRNDKQIAGDNK